MDIETFRKKIDCGEFKVNSSQEVVKTGELASSEGKTSKYAIHHGWDLISSNRIDKAWSAYYLKLFEIIKSKNYSEDKLNDILSQIQTEDKHWDWFAKSYCYCKDCYDWFYLFADEEPQGACLIYHPKSSLIDSKEIFYIEFVAIAPWNRKNPILERKYKGVGTILIVCALNFSVNVLGLHSGFSLNSLPQAKEYYKKIGMKNFPERDKEEMPYFEMPRSKCIEMMGEK